MKTLIALLVFCAGCGISPLSPAPGCLDSLATAGGRDLRVSLTLTAIAGDQPLLNQRSTCDAKSAFWSIELARGGVVASIGSGSSIASTLSAAVNDGKKHRVVFSRRYDVLYMTVDSALVTEMPFNHTIFDRSLPALEVGLDLACAKPRGDAVVEDVCLEVL